MCGYSGLVGELFSKKMYIFCDFIGSELAPDYILIYHVMLFILARFLVEVWWNWWLGHGCQFKFLQSPARYVGLHGLRVRMSWFSRVHGLKLETTSNLSTCSILLQGGLTNWYFYFPKCLPAGNPQLNPTKPTWTQKRPNLKSANISSITIWCNVQSMHLSMLRTRIWKGTVLLLLW